MLVIQASAIFMEKLFSVSWKHPRRRKTYCVYTVSLLTTSPPRSDVFVRLTEPKCMSRGRDHGCERCGAAGSHALRGHCRLQGDQERRRHAARGAARPAAEEVRERTTLGAGVRLVRDYGKRKEVWQEIIRLSKTLVGGRFVVGR